MRKGKDNLLFLAICSMAIIMMSSVILAPALGSTDVDITRADPVFPATVTVNLEYSNGDPADSFEVKLLNIFETSYYTLYDTTDMDGECIFTVNANNWGPCRLWASEGTGTYWWSDELFVEPNGDHLVEGVVDLYMPYDNSLPVKVIDSSTGLVMGGVEVEVTGVDLARGPVNILEVTDPDGTLTVDLPDSNTPFDLKIDHMGYDEYLKELYLPSGGGIQPLEIHLRPEYIPDVKVSLRTVDAATNDVIPLKYASLRGSVHDNDHLSFFKSSYTSDPVTGYSDIMAGPGEYEFHMETESHPEGRVSMRVYGYMIVNETDIEYEARLPVPGEWRAMNLTVSSESLPVSSAYVSYSQTLGGTSLECIVGVYGYTNSSGEFNAYLPPDEKITLRISRYGYEGQTIIIPPAPADEPAIIDVTLEKSVEKSYPKGNISIKVVDPQTGIIIPRARIHSSTYDYEEKRWITISGSAGENGYYNSTVDAATYESISAYYNIGKGFAENVSVMEGETTTIVIDIERYDFLPDPVEISIQLRTESGDLIPHQPVTMRNNLYSNYRYKPVSDGSGIIKAWVLPGLYEISTDSEYPSLPHPRNHWVMTEFQVEVTDTGGSLPDIVMYPSFPLDSIYGFIKDSGTGNPIAHQNIHTGSVRFLEIPNGSSRQIPYVMPYFEQFRSESRPYVPLYSTHDAGSDNSGFYRTWGRESVRISIWRDGYFPYDRELDMMSRSGTELDILMDPLPAYTTWVNGTLMDIEGNPLEGGVALVDPENDHYLVSFETVNESGNFSLECYPGSLRAVFGNSSLWEQMDLEIHSEGIEGLELVLAPTSYINGTVTDSEGDPVEGIELHLEMAIPPVAMPEGFAGPNQTSVTDANGSFSFWVVAGQYSIIFQGSDHYLPVTLFMESTGNEPIHVDIILDNRTFGHITGEVIGIGGPLESGIPGAILVLYDSDGVEIATAITDMNGSYLMENVTYGTEYMLVAAPPSEMEWIEEVRSGYLGNITENITLSGYMKTINVSLSYIEFSPTDYLSLIENRPSGGNVGLNENIRIHFSHEMNRTALETYLEISPDLTLTGFSWSSQGDIVTITHGNFQPMTTYSILIPPTVVSKTGLTLLDPTGYQWEFTTGTEELEWYLEDATVDVNSDRSLDVEATGGSGQSVYLIIEGVGPFELFEEAEGVYTGYVEGFLLEWDTEYEYYFTDQPSGGIIWDALGGSFRTPVTDDEEPVDDDDEEPVDDDDDEGNLFRKSLVRTAVCCGIGSVILIIILLLIIVMIKSRKGKDIEE